MDRFEVIYRENTPMGKIQLKILVDKETGEVYAAHAFSLVNFAVAAPGDYSGWGWTFQ